MSSRLDRLLKATEKKKPSKRVCADSTVLVEDVQRCISTFLRGLGSRDLWAAVVPGPDGSLDGSLFFVCFGPRSWDTQ